MQKTNTVAKISDSAEFLTMGINAIQSKMGMDDILTVGGVSWWPRLMWGAGAPGDSMLAISLLRQELAEQGILIGSTLNMMLSHTQDDVKHDVLSRWEKAMAVLKTAFESPDPSQYLRGKKMSPPYSVR
jgi:hypothetical protein